MTFSNDMGGDMGKNVTNVVDGMYAYQVRSWTRTKMEAIVNVGYFTGGYSPFGLQKVMATKATGFHRTVVPLIITTPQFFDAPVFVPPGGQNRTKMPRPW